MIDYFLLNKGIPAPEKELVQKVRQFVDTHVIPNINGYWERAEFPHDLLEPLSKLGIVGGTISEYGGPGLSTLGAGLVTRELSRGDGSVNAFFGVQSNLTIGTLDLLASSEQKQRWLPGLIELKKIGAWALTEPNHGSDSVALETTATRDGDDWILNGEKRWIGNASWADLVIVWARDTEDSKVKAFVIEQPARGKYVEGFTAQVITGKIGKRAILQPDIQLNNVRVPDQNRLVDAKSFRDVNRVLARTRGGVSWEAVGHAEACLEIAIEYSKSRHQFGKPIGSFQLVQNKLAWMLAELTSMQLICHQMVELQSSGEWTVEMASLAKLHTARKSLEICSAAKELLGGNGLLLENHVARHLTDMEVVHTYEGTEFMQSLILGRDLTGISAFS